MKCLNCGNCKENQQTYYCLAKNEIIINKNYVPKEKKRSGWKKGSTKYENHRRNTKKEEEILKGV